MATKLTSQSGPIMQKKSNGHDKKRLYSRILFITSLITLIPVFYASYLVTLNPLADPKAVKITILTWMGLAMAFTIVAYFWDRTTRGAFSPDKSLDTAEGAPNVSDYVKGPSVSVKRNEGVLIIVCIVITLLLVLFAVYGLPTF